MAKRSTERVLNDEIAAANVALERARKVAADKLAALQLASEAHAAAHGAVVMAEHRLVRATRALEAFLPLPFPEPSPPPAAATAPLELTQPSPLETKTDPPVQPSPEVLSDTSIAAAGDECPLCGDGEQLILAATWRDDVDAGGSIPVVGCGNPWHYVDQHGNLAVAPDELARLAPLGATEISKDDVLPARSRR